MKKVSLFIMIVSLLVVPVSNTFAQDEMVLPSCTDEELAATIEGINEVNAGFEELATSFDLSADPNDNAYGETIVALEAIASAYWTEFFPEVPECAEALGIAYVVGAFYEDYLTTGLLLNAAGWAEAAGETEAAAEIAEQAGVRLEDVNATAEEISGMTFEELAAELFANDLPACNEEQMSEAEAAFDEAYEAIASLEEENADDSLALFAISEATSYTFDAEVYPAASTCAELAAVTDVVSIALSVANTAAGLYANAEIEEAAGNSDVAQAMYAASEARGELFDSLMGMLETAE